MATTFKTLTANDIANTRTLLHEAIPLTGTIVSGTYTDENIKTYSHGMFQSVYDYPYLSSSANHIFDVTVGYSTDSVASSSNSDQNSKKINIYNQMAQVLVGHDATGSIQAFDKDGNIAAGGTKLDEVFFVNFARLLTKDEVKKGGFVATFLTGGTPLVRTNELTVGDYGANSTYLVNSPAGEYAVLYTSSAVANSNSGVGLLYYQAGVAVISGSVFSNNPTGEEDGGPLPYAGTSMGPGQLSGTFSSLLTGSNINGLSDAIRNRMVNISFNNTVELNSTIYFCRIGHNEFNYSANPTYLSASQIRVKNSSTDNPVSYITTVGLYSADNELLAVAKLSEPLQKKPDTELNLRVRLDY